MTRLEIARRRRGMRLEDVALAADCSISMVSLVEKLERVPSELLARRLALAVGIAENRWPTLQRRG